MRQNAATSRTRSQRSKHWLLGFLGISLLVVIIARCWPREPLLLDRAVRVTNTQNWNLTHDHYDWITNDTVLHVDTGRKPEGAYLKNIRAHTDTELRRLNQLTNRMSYGHAVYTVSPDRQWILWVSDAEDRVVAATLDDAKHVRWLRKGRWPQAEWGQTFWLPDSRHWIELVINSNYGVKAERIYDVNAPGKR